MRIMTEQECVLVEAHMALVETVIQRHITVRPDVPGLEHDDLFQVGSLALCRAAQRYDGRCQFSTFAYTVVKNALLDHCRSMTGKVSRTVSLAPSEEEEGASLLTELLIPSRCPIPRRPTNCKKPLPKPESATAVWPARAFKRWKCRCTDTPRGRSPSCMGYAPMWLQPG